MVNWRAGTCQNRQLHTTSSDLLLNWLHQKALSVNCWVNDKMSILFCASGHWWIPISVSGLLWPNIWNNNINMWFGFRDGKVVSAVPSAQIPINIIQASISNFNQILNILIKTRIIHWFIFYCLNWLCNCYIPNYKAMCSQHKAEGHCQRICECFLLFFFIIFYLLCSIFPPFLQWADAAIGGCCALTFELSIIGRTLSCYILRSDGHRLEFKHLYNKKSIFFSPFPFLLRNISSV